MSDRGRHQTLAIAPVSRGFGYVVFDGSRNPTDWGVKEVRRDKNDVCLALAKRLIETHRPTTLVVEDWHDHRCRRRTRIRVLLEQLAETGARAGVVVATVGRSELLAGFSGAGAQTKDEIAHVVARAIPTLARRLPARRRVWQSERYAMAIFEAAAWALALFTRAPTDDDGYSLRLGQAGDEKHQDGGA